jgi:hypothetical protein
MFFYYPSRNEMEKEIIIGRRRGADRICPNDPDEG